MLNWVKAVVGCLAIILLPNGASAQAQTSDPLLGIWAGEITGAPVLHVALVVILTGTEWRATIGSASTTFRSNGDSIRFSRADSLGIFRGVIGKGAATIDGWWIQPTSIQFGNPMATTLTLRRTGPDSWRGEVTPVEEKYTLYLVVSRTATGSLIGAFSKSGAQSARRRVPVQRAPRR
jgi:hypothetical protein